MDAFGRLFKGKMLKEKVIEAYDFFKKKHDATGKKRAFVSHLDYWVHPKAVARIIEHLTKDEKLVIVALGHDSREDTDTTYEEIKVRFGEEIADWVEELTLPDKLKREDKKEALAERMRMMSAEALTVKLADRFHNVLFLENDGVPLRFVKRYWVETKYILKEISDRKLNTVQELLVRRINVILDFLEIRHGLNGHK